MGKFTTRKSDFGKSFFTMERFNVAGEYSNPLELTNTCEIISSYIKWFPNSQMKRELFAVYLLADTCIKQQKCSQIGKRS